MAKDWDKMDPYEQRMAMSAIGRDFFDVEGTHNATEWGKDQRTSRDVSEDLAKAMGNDYDVREYLRYTGGDMPTTDEEMYNLHHEMKKDHKQNRGGAYNSRSDMAGVSERSFDDFNDKFQQSILDDVMAKMPSTNDTDETSEEENNTGMSWSEAQANGILSDGVREAIDRGSNQEPKQTEAQDAAQGMLASTVNKIVGDEYKMAKSKQAELDYNVNFNNPRKLTLS